MKAKYYDINPGFFPTQIKVCFNEKDYHQILKDYDIQLRNDEGNPLAMGVAETHAFMTPRECVIIMVFNLDVLEDDAAGLIGVVAHEATHVIERILEHIGEERDDLGEETRAYLTQHIVEQTMKACLIEVKKRAKRKTNRAEASKKSQSKRGSVFEVDESGDDGSPRQASLFPWESDTGGVEGHQGDAVSAADTNDLDTK